MQNYALILSNVFDAHADVVESKMQCLKIPYFRLNLDVESLKNTTISFECEIWHVSHNKQTITSKNISCVWLRNAFVEMTLQERALLENVDFKIWRNEFNATLLGFYAHLKSIPWLNLISNAFKGENKYFQMQLAKICDLKMPKTLVSNDKNLLIKFAKSCDNDVIFKLLNQDIHTNKDNKMQGVYANRINTEKLKSFKTNGENPIMLQEYIQKSYEVRYTVVGKEHFVCKIESQKSKIASEDWRRYDLANTPHLIIKPPKDIKAKVIKLMKLMKLEFAAIDFIVTPKNEWIFLEINCNGQWLWIEQLSGLDISGGIVKWITKHTKINT